MNKLYDRHMQVWVHSETMETALIHATIYCANDQETTIYVELEVKPDREFQINSANRMWFRSKGWEFICNLVDMQEV